MNTKNILKTLALAMLLVSACNKSEIANDENADKKGFALPVTVNVTREGDDATKATYNESTRKLEFSAGDKLFVGGNYDDWDKRFAGTLDYDAESGKFKGTIYTQDDTYKTYEELFGYSDYTIATLLPAGYNDHGYLVINTNDPDAQYDDFVEESNEYILATSKADGVAQFSYEKSYNYIDGFALSPDNAILNFTITGLAASTSVNVSLTSMAYNITGTVTTDAFGNATFAAGIMAGLNLQPFSLTVGGKNITIVSSDKDVAKGKIYNITRSAAPAATSLSELKTAINGGTDCSSYIGWEVNSAGAIAASSVSGTKIGYVAYVSTSDVDANVSGSRILVIASSDAAATTLTWGSYGTARGVEAVEGANDLRGYSNTNALQGYGSEAHPAAYAAWNYSATIPSGGASPAHWFMPTRKQWENMRDAKGGTYSAMATAYGIDGNYWTSNEYFNGSDYSECDTHAWIFVTNSDFNSFMKLFDTNVRSIFAY